MAGLESIALAVDFLEQRESMTEAATELKPTLISTVAPTADEAPIPPRTGFLNAPRRVSSDSVNNEEEAPLAKPRYSPPSVTASSPTPPPHGELVVSGDMSPEVISRMVEDLSNDSEFQGPPPPPPPPTEVIVQVKDCDVLCGRGGETNHHTGNVRYRVLVKRYQPLYIMSKRRDKPLIASKIVRLVRHSGGRFLRKDKNNGWRDVGNTKAREKTSQALREGAPDLRSPPKNPKEEQQVSPSPTVTGSSVGIRKQPDFPVGYGPATMGGLYAGAAIVETRPGEVDGFGPAAKKMRETGPPIVSPGVALAGLTFWAAPQHAFLPQGQFFGVPPPTLPMAQPVMVSASSPAFAATVSADDDDSKSAEGRGTPSPKPRGPRLKLLKRRLQEEQETGN